MGEQHSGKPKTTNEKKRKINNLLRELSDAEDDDSIDPAAPIDPQRPWRTEFNAYIQTREQLLEKMTTISWWGVGTNI
jgi:hypothetical protein